MSTCGVLRWCRHADGDHNVASESKQLRESVDLPVVQRPRDDVLSVPATNKAAPPRFKQLQYWRDGNVEDESSW